MMIDPYEDYKKPDYVFGDVHVEYVDPQEGDDLHSFFLVLRQALIMVVRWIERHHLQKRKG